MSKQFGARTTALEVIGGHNLKRKEVIVTGSASGIGVETARALAKAGARVVIAARDIKKAEEVAAYIKNTTGNNNVEVEELELGSLKSIYKFFERYLAKRRPLHILVNNAGMMNTPQGVTEDGFELQFGVNHIGHFALTVGLLPALKEAKNARVVNVSSLAHIWSDIVFEDINFKNRAYEGFLSYGQSKTANSLFSVKLTKRFKADGITSNAVMPGGIMTNLQRHMPREAQIQMGLFDEAGNINPQFKTVEQGASTSVWAAVAPELEGKGGLYLEHCQIASLIPAEVIQKAFSGNFKDGFPEGYLAYAVNQENAEKLCNVTEDLIANVNKN
jgi:NAD(P)-dependent dehydrogenase (short-subunit alcohol dehydrogenase family)